MLPAPASAQQRPSDPEANSPSGVTYELPFDRARRDAAPRSREDGPGRGGGNSRDRGRAEGDGGGPAGGGVGGGPAPGREPTSIRSDNNFGSSSQVPGVDDAGGSAAGSRGDGGQGAERRERASADDATGAPSASGDGEASERRSALPDPASVSTDGGVSDSTVISLLALLLIVGTGIGVMAGRARRHRS